MNDSEAYLNILRRRSCRAYFQTDLTAGEVSDLLSAAFSAPYAAKDSRRYTVVHGRGILERLNAAAKRAALDLKIPGLGQLAAKPEFDCTHGAPTAVIISGGEHSVSPLADCSAAAENLCLAAQALGLGACWIYFPLLAFEGEEGAAWRGECQIPEGFKPMAVVAVGHRKGGAPAPVKRAEPVYYVM